MFGGVLWLNKFLSWNFAGLLLLVVILFMSHEFGHYLAYHMLGYKATIRKSIFAPGIDPKETITVPGWQGVFIASFGFVFSTAIVVFPLFFIKYQYWFVLLIGSIAGSIVDMIWAISMVGRKTVTIDSRKSC